MSRDWDDMPVVGRIVRPHGHKGNVVVDPDTDFGAVRFAPGATLIWNRGGTPSEVQVVDGREHDGRWVVTLEGITSMNDAETLRGLELRVPAETLPPLGPGQYYTHDLLGCQVETTGGEVLGRVDRVDLAATPLLAIVGPTNEILVPLADAICRRVDVDAKVIVIDPPPGLIELNERGAR